MNLTGFFMVIFVGFAAVFGFSVIIYDWLEARGVRKGTITGERAEKIKERMKRNPNFCPFFIPK